jgi:hypothetical protein
VSNARYHDAVDGGPLRPLGFAALWRETEREYHASKDDEWSTTERIQAAFASGRERGIRAFGLYHCRWSSEWRYLTFWICPDLTSLYETIAELERAGDFKFADSAHFVGSLVEDKAHLNPGVWEAAPEPRDGEPVPLGLFIAWRRSCRPRSEGSLELSPIEKLRTLGQYDCGFGSEWERFTFWIAPDLRTAEEALDALERSNPLSMVEAQVVMGSLERYYRFGSHLQTDFPWLEEEGRE